MYVLYFVIITLNLNDNRSSLPINITAVALTLMNSVNPYNEHFTCFH